ncbi:MAG: thioredoxin family protein [Chloroflexi bacterium]|nr:thioredoxin family protein [Chloroflexota bacterium]
MATADVITTQRFSQGFTYQDYLNSLGDTRQRFADHEAAFRLAPADAKFFKDGVKRLGPIKVVAIVEDWCPDVHRGLPIMAAIAQASGMEMRAFPRDKNLDMMNLYLKQGKFQSIPVFAFFDRNLNPLCHWIERPEAATRFQEEIAAELAKKQLSEEEARQERRKRTQPMTDTWRQETVKELRELFAKIPPARK